VAEAFVEHKRPKLGQGSPEQEFIESIPPNPGVAFDFNPGKTRERTRAWLAAVLAVLLFAVVIITLIAVVAASYPTEEAVKLLGVLLSPLVGLVGAATGFYYAGVEKEGQKK